MITQLFYDNADFFRFRERCRQIGITRADRAGHFAGDQLRRSSGSRRCAGPSCRPNSRGRLAAEADDAEGQFDVGVEFATRQVQELVDAGMPGVHFYVLNKSPATAGVLRAVRLPG